MNCSIDKIRHVVGIVSLLLLPVAPISLSFLQVQNRYLIYINYGVLLTSGFGLVWCNFYYSVIPFWIGILLTFIHALLVILLIFLSKWVGLPRYDLVGIMLSGALGLIIYTNRDKIVCFIMSFIKNH